jgi:hypothetical protein
MNTNRLSVAAAIFLLAGAPASAHRLDEYLQATLISVEKDRVEAQMRLVPGVAVSSFVLTSMHANADGAISEAEQQAYAKRVLRDVSLKVDGVFLRPRLNSVEFPGVEEMKEGVGEIRIEFSAALPRGGGSRRLVFENHHQNRNGERSGSARPGYTGGGTESERAAVVLSIGLRAGWGVFKRRLGMAGHGGAAAVVTACLFVAAARLRKRCAAKKSVGRRKRLPHSRSRLPTTQHALLAGALGERVIAFLGVIIVR